MAKKIIALMLCASLLLSSCRAAGPLPPQGNEPETRTDEEIAAAAAETRADIRAIFPDADFTVDRAGAVSLEYTGKAAQLSVTDDAGLTWTVSIPQGALAVPTTITMTPLTDVSDGRGSRSGVRFGPDGLTFLMPATLTVTGPGADRVLLYADEGGRDMVPASFAPGEDGTLLFHFSTAFADSSTGDPADDAEFMRQADELYGQYYDKARKLLDKQIKPPKPLKLDLKCFDYNALEEIEAQIVGAVKEELTYAAALWISLGAAMMREDAARAMDLHRVIQGLTQRALQKLEMMISLDNPKPETYFYAVYSLNAHLGLVGITPSPTPATPIPSRPILWGRQRNGSRPLLQRRTRPENTPGVICWTA
ncbi:MAG: DUF4402 domain-containing protein [Eubacteriales bacterium]|nr:DUF4402 domain-containing protein [Eubacteriales bacterium]